MRLFYDITTRVKETDDDAVISFQVIPKAIYKDISVHIGITVFYAYLYEQDFIDDIFFSQLTLNGETQKVKENIDIRSKI